MSFVHLHTHTEYSLLDGSNKITEYVERVKALGMTSAAITDHGVMYGVIDFYKEAKKQGINPVLGCEVYVAPGSRFDKTPVRRGGTRYYHLVLLAENNKGFENLIKIVSKGFTEGFYAKPRVDLEVLRTYSEGLIALSACLAGEVQKHLLNDRMDDAKEAAKRYEEIFGKGNFFLELQDHGMHEQKLVNERQIRLSKETGIPLVATNDCHYTFPEDAMPHDILLCMQTGKKLQDEDRMRYEGGQYYVKSEEEMRRLFPYAEAAIQNTGKIAERCHVDIAFGVTKLPNFDVPGGLSAWDYLNRLCMEGMERHYGKDKDRYMDRLTYELGVIKSMGYVEYFLIVMDYIRFAKSHGIKVGPGRGSAAGSLVAYCLDITMVDPMRYNLIFERFLNPERVSMPDIDVDFCYERRQEVIDYVVEKYGKEEVVQIIAFGTLAARAVVKDVGRVMDVPYAFADGIAKMIPKEVNMTLEKALNKNPELKKRYEEEVEVQTLIDMAKRLEGLPKNITVHAAGVVISKKPVQEYVPLALGSENNVITQYAAPTLEELGLLKMDLLGLRTLTVIRDTVDLINEKRAEPLDIDQMDYNDRGALDLIGTGDTDGVFQLESEGMKKFMRELKPDSLEEVIAGISLYRPGPMDFIPQFIAGKSDPEGIRYKCPELKPILKSTYGCIVYQEQVMQIVRDLAGFSMGRSDNLRRAMSKKKAKVMEQERQVFVYGDEKDGIPGCKGNGIDEKTANAIYDEMIDFAKYAFNKSHAAAYAYVSMQTAYLKNYYPVEFMAAAMTSVIENPDKLLKYIYATRHMGIRLLPPDINEGDSRFKALDGAIRYGLLAIKRVGKPILDGIIKERDTNGRYKDLKDFIKRTSSLGVNKRAIESFIKAGALDSLPGTRKQLMAVYEEIVDQVTKESKNVVRGQMSLFDFARPEDKKQFEISLPGVGEYDKETLYAFEKEMTGIYLSGHPLENYTDMLEAHITAKSFDFKASDDTGEIRVRNGAREVLGGMLTNVTPKLTKKNQLMATAKIEDPLGSVDLIVFPKAYEAYRSAIYEEAKVFVSGRVSEEADADSKLFVDKVTPFGDISKKIYICVDNYAAYTKRREALAKVLLAAPGKDRVIIYLSEEKALKELPEHLKTRAEGDVLAKLVEICGQDHVKVVE